jgi:DNA-binding ferritin-like protein
VPLQFARKASGGWSGASNRRAKSGIQSLGGIGIAMAYDVAETALMPKLLRGRQPAPVHLSPLLHAYEIVLLEARTMAKQAAEAGDDGTNLNRYLFTERFATIPAL